MENAIKYTTLDGVAVSLMKGEYEKAMNFTLSEKEWLEFANLCRQTKLNPYTKDIYCQKFDAARPAQTFVGKHGLLKVATSNPDFDGLEDGIIYSIDGNIIKDKDSNGVEYPGTRGTFMPSNAVLLGGWAIAHSNKIKFPKISTVAYDMYAKKKNGKAYGAWESLKTVMINKVAIATALRELFPQSFAGVYDEAEIDKDRTVDVSVGEVKVSSPEKSTTVPTLNEALVYELKDGKCKGKILKDLVDAKKADPMPWIEAYSKTSGADGVNAKVILDALKAGTLKLAFTA